MMEYRYVDMMNANARYIITSWSRNTSLCVYIHDVPTSLYIYKNTYRCENGHIADDEEVQQDPERLCSLEHLAVLPEYANDVATADAGGCW